VSADVHSLIGPYLLDALDDVERAAFDRHLRECGDCRAEVGELREAAARLADGAWSVPPPRLRTDVLAAVATTRQVTPETPPAARPAAGTGRRRLLTAAAVLVAAAGAGTTAWVVQDDRVRSEHAAA
jgi:anti-sigma factor RsiW